MKRWTLAISMVLAGCANDPAQSDPAPSDIGAGGDGSDIPSSYEPPAPSTKLGCDPKCSDDMWCDQRAAQCVDYVDFDTQIFPLLQKYACVGCHKAGEEGAVTKHGKTPAIFSGTAADVYRVLTEDGRICTGDDVKRVCVNQPELSPFFDNTLYHKVQNDANANWVFRTADEPNAQLIYQWIAQGAVRLSGSGTCGNGVLESKEACDGALGASCEYGSDVCVHCTALCTLESEPAGAPRCGDGIVNGKETCDDGNHSTEYCSATPNGCKVCGSDCTFVAGPYCGDGIVNGKEACDDGNQTNLDGCDDNCRPSAPIVALGTTHGCVAMPNGKVRCWGSDGSGALGSGNTNAIATPFKAQDLPLPGNAVDVAVGSSHSCALLDDGTVRCWGSNYYGQLGVDGDALGDNESVATAKPVRLKGKAVRIAANDYTTCALLEGGLLSCWGGSSTSWKVDAKSTYPVLPAGAVDLAMNIGGSVSLLTRQNELGSVTASGAIPEKFVGTALPHQALRLSDTCTVFSDGTARCGNDDLSASEPITFAIRAGALSQYDWDTSSKERTCILTESGLVRCTERVSKNLPPTAVFELQVPGATRLTTSGWPLTRLCISSSEAPHVRCFGLDGAMTQPTSALGDDESIDGFDAVQLSLPAVSVGAGLDHSCALLVDGRVECWGNPAAGTSNAWWNVGLSEPPKAWTAQAVAPYSAELFVGAQRTALDTTPYDRNFDWKYFGNWDATWQLVSSTGGWGSCTPVTGVPELAVSAIPLPSSAVVLQTTWGRDHGCVLVEGQAENEVYCGLDNGRGQVDASCYSKRYDSCTGYHGDLYSEEYYTDYCDRFVRVGQGNIDELAAGDGFTCLRTVDGYVRCWGEGFGPFPGAVALSNGASKLFAGPMARYACGEDASGLKCWGDVPALGFVAAATPVSIDLGFSPESLSLGANHACALSPDKKVLCWGQNESGQLGLGHAQTIGDDEGISALSRGDAAYVPLAHPALAVSAGQSHTCALLEGGEVQCWGNGETGRLGHPFCGGGVELEAACTW